MGLCRSCRHVRVVTARVNSRYYRCELSDREPRYPRYPALPVLACGGHEPAASPPRAAAESRAAPRRMGGERKLSACATIVLAAGLGVAVPAQEAARTAWGDPDLQGIWVASTLTPLERPSEYRGREFLSEAEVAALEAEARVEEQRLLNRPAERAPAGGDVDYRPDGSLGLNLFWLDEGTAWDPSRRTSLIVDPPSGRIPYLPTARDHERPYGTGPWDSHVDLDTGERCFGDGFPQVWFGDNPNHQILQTPTDVVILHEMYHQRRIIPIDGRPQTGIAQWNGEPRGRWEGRTLVVESRYFPDRPQDRFRHVWRAPASTLHLVERFTRAAAETIRYEATITDPVRFSQPWTVRFTLATDQARRGVTPGPLFEFACHEGNYAIVNVLRGARVQDSRAAGR